MPALFRQGEKIEVHWDSLAASTAALITFAFTLDVLGVFLSSVIAVLIASLPKPYAFWRAWRIGHHRLRLSLSLIFIAGSGYDCFPVSSAVNPMELTQ